MQSDSNTKHIGRYENIRVLGKGSQGSVVLARDPTLDRFVAIKLLSAKATELNVQDDDGTPVEARTSSKLKHPNIIPIFDAGRTADGPYLVFEYVEGVPLAAVLASEKKFSIEKAIPLIRSVLDAMAHAHSSEILHLDLSPRNILIGEDQVPRVMDFGLAQYVNFTREPSDMASGTLRYMAPEHMLQKPLGTWTDVFALGITFYELVSGVRPFDGIQTREIQLKIAAAKVDMAPIHALPHGESFARFLAGALERNREGRYADASAMREAFELFLADSGLSESGKDEAAAHSTIEFLMRRMSRKKDFPSISQTLTDINRLTSEGSTASADKLAEVILRDFSLTSKLLKLVNSAYYGARAVEVTSISQAVVILGVRQVRMTANSLSFFGHLRGDSEALKDSMTRSFLSGMIARHLAKLERLPDPEEAFICAMCQNLGENLVMYYFAEDFDDIVELQRTRKLDKTAASRGVLGVSYAELGAAVAKVWNLPKSIVHSIRGMPAGEVVAPNDDATKLRDIAVMANCLCEALQQDDATLIDYQLDAVLERFAASVVPQRNYCVQLITLAFEKVIEYAPIFEINVSSSHYCSSVKAWLALHPVDEEGKNTATG
ncbi:MAG: HDOD domain-containing protein [Woeseia sp.]